MSPTSVGEDDAKTEFTVTASLGGSTTRPSDTEVTLTLGGTAGSSDYTVNTSLASITIPANATSASGTLELTPTDDAIVEGDETIVISGTTTVTGLTVSSATITLTDDDKTTTTPTDDKDSAELSITGPSANVTEGSDATFTVTLSAAVSQGSDRWPGRPLGTDRRLRVLSDLRHGDVRGGQRRGGHPEHHDHRDGRRAFGDGGVVHRDPGDDHNDAVVQMTLKSGASSATATIAASDPITVSISGPSTVDEGDATSNYTVSLSPSGVTPTADLTVSYGTSDGTATAGSDYTAKRPARSRSRTRRQGRRPSR